MKNTLLIFLGASTRQEDWWKYYEKLDPGIEHDILVAYIDKTIIPETIKNNHGKLFYESKIIEGKDIPHRAFGAYRYFFNKYRDQYRYFGFVSDDVIVRSKNWLKRCIEPLARHERLGWTATQIYSGKYSQCFPDHFRAPIWFAKSEALSQIKWEFDSDHHGEIVTANQFLDANYFGIQVGHKFDIAYDSLEAGDCGLGDGIISCFEKKFFPKKRLELPFSEDELNKFKTELWDSIKQNKIEKWYAISPYDHIQEKNFITELQGLDGQVYVPALNLAKQCLPIYENKQLNIQILQNFAPPELLEVAKKTKTTILKKLFRLK